MYDIVRDSPLGQCIRILTCGRIFKYPEETADFTLPLLYQSPVGSKATADRFTGNDLEASHGDARSDSANSPLRTQDGITIVTWYSPDDPENPYNWTPGKKLWVGILLFIYTFAVYIGSSLYTASEPDIVKIYHVSNIAASIGLTLYVLGYGIGPMLFSPLSEIPVIGRNSIYIITFVIFTVLCVPMALVDNFAGILVLRFLLGFFGSPCLATAGASYGDFYGPTQLPYVIAMWGGGATLGPALGPLVGGFAVQEMTWRWSSWELLWLSAPIMILMFCTMPETSSDKILLRRAQRLRLLTGREDLKSESETRQEKMNPREMAFFALIKPWQINALDPAVLFSTFYTGLTYGIYYSFFECFPMVYNDMYGFNLGQLGLAFLSVLVGLFVAVVLLCAYLNFIAPKRLGRFDPAGVPPEERIWPGLFATFLIPLGLYLFARVIY
ncbi:hypothetical protein Plec18167_003786 [Paecilomyces lecythidis]|uniref:Major facilitator superfamily (MFS) profile domain-containing protein n=1 Tax=Paecilomyces lecythidis TaxID=3004212 RepID=A0ABR3XWL4_9EURO